MIKQLIQILRPHLYEGIKSIYSESKDRFENDDSDSSHSILMIFQDLLSNIPKWNQTIIEEETQRIISNSGCDW